MDGEKIFIISAFSFFGLFLLGVIVIFIGPDITDSSLEKYCRENDYERIDKIDGHFNCCKTEIELNFGKYVETETCVAAGGIPEGFRKFKG